MKELSKLPVHLLKSMCCTAKIILSGHLLIIQCSEMIRERKYFKDRIKGNFKFISPEAIFQ